jgi:hypothetical protein
MDANHKDDVKAEGNGRINGVLFTDSFVCSC